MGVDTNDTIGENILREWAQIAGLDPRVLLANTPQARVTQLQVI